MYETVSQIVDDVVSKLTDDDKSFLKDSDEFLLHSTLGRKIRNEYGLWNNPEKLAKDCLDNYYDDAVATKTLWENEGWSKEEGGLILDQVHPDDISEIIINRILDKLNHVKSS